MSPRVMCAVYEITVYCMSMIIIYCFGIDRGVVIVAVVRVENNNRAPDNRTDRIKGADGWTEVISQSSVFSRITL